MLSVAERHRALETTASAVRACTLCRLHRKRTNAVPGEGPADAAVLLIGEAPGQEEDRSGRPFVGRAGRILDAALSSAGLARNSVFITNVVKCRPPRNRRPKADEAATCRSYLLGQIASIQPRIIVTLGATALRDVLGPGHELKASRGQALRFGEIPVTATYHPAAVLYNRRLEPVLRRDLLKVARSLGTAPRPRRARRTSGRTTSPGRRATR